MDEKTKKVLFYLLNSRSKGVDTYHNNGSMWLIFTDEKKWVLELTKEGTLWYNYHFFQNFFKLMSLDVVENQHYITKWVEDTIQNGVRNTDSWVGKPFVSVEYTIQNGVKETTPSGYLGSIEMKGKIVHQFESPKQNNEVEDVIQNGVRKIEGEPHDYPHTVANIIKNGVKKTEMEEHHRLREVVQTVKNGIKETKYCELNSLMRADHIIRDGVKETWGYEKQPQVRVNEVIRGGVKETNWRRVDNHPTYLDNIIKSSN
jgi:hypothetical protein